MEAGAVGRAADVGGPPVGLDLGGVGVCVGFK